MIKGLLFLFLFFVSGIWLFEKIQNDPGYVLISLDGQTLEASFWFAVTSLIIIFAVVFFIWHFIKKIMLVLISGTTWYSRTRSRSIESRYREGLLNFLTEDYKLASKQLASVSRRAQLPVVRALVNAQSLARQGETEKALSVLDEAKQRFPDDVVWVLKAEVPLLIDTNKHREAELAIDELRTLPASNDAVKKFEHMQLTKKEDWQNVTALVADKSLAKTLQGDELIQTYVQALQQLYRKIETDLAETNNPSKDEKLVQAKLDIDSLWSSVPKKIKTDSKLITQYAPLLYLSEQYADLEELIVYTLNKQWLPSLVDLYAKLPSEDSEQQQKRAERWLKENEKDVILLVTLGVLSIKNQLWGKAKNYFKSANDVQESARATYFLGYLAEKQGDEKTSHSYYKRAAELGRDRTE